MPRTPINPFVDLEAEVDRYDEEESDKDEQEMQDFLDFDEVSQDQQHVEDYQTWNSLQRALDEGTDGTLEDDRETESFLAHLKRHKSSTRRVIDVDSAIVLPTQKYPLHRVACRVGMEEEAMAFILQKTRNERIASAFFRETIRGYVYIEAITDQAVIHLLTKTPGIRRTTRGPIIQGVDEPDWSKLLTMKPALSSNQSLKEGNWVTVKNGKMYKGDVALVKRIDAWGVQVLLVPRIPPLSQSFHQLDHNDGAKKRKTNTAVPEAQLFQDWDMARKMGLDVVEDAPHCYHFGNNFFEYGLQRRNYSFHSVQTAVISIPAATFHLFIKSHHPFLRYSVDQLPKPREWIIEEGDQIEDYVSKRSGTVHKIHTTHIEFDCDDGSGLNPLPWRFVRKVVKVSDCVEVASGEKGWVVAKSDDILHIVNKLQEDASNISTEITEFDVHVNRIKHTTMAFIQSTVRTSPIAGTKRDYIPWVGTCVLVTKGAWKGHHACIQTVVSHEETMKLLVRLEDYNPHHAFNSINLGVDDVVEAVTRLHLIEYSAKSHLYVPKHNHPHNLNVLSPSITGLNDASNTNPGTPLPTPVVSPTLLSAWDPNSRTPAGFETPRVDDDAQRLFTLPQPSRTVTPPPPHPLLNQCLLDIRLKANVHGGGIPGTEMAVWLNNKDDGSLGFQCVRAGRKIWLQPQWLELRRPNPVRADNGLMAVVDDQSIYFGRLVRRVSHFKKADQFVMRCVVVTCVPGSANAITLEEPDSLDKSQLCLCFETKEEKDMNKAVVSQLRARGRST